MTEPAAFIVDEYRLRELAECLDERACAISAWAAVCEMHVGWRGIAASRIETVLDLEHSGGNPEQQAWRSWTPRQLAEVAVPVLAEVVGPYWWQVPYDEAVNAAVCALEAEPDKSIVDHVGYELLGVVVTAVVGVPKRPMAENPAGEDILGICREAHRDDDLEDDA